MALLTALAVDRAYALAVSRRCVLILMEIGAEAVGLFDRCFRPCRTKTAADGL